MSGSLTRSFGTNKAKEQEGIWVEIAVNDDESIARMLVLRAGQRNKEFTVKFASLGKKFRMMRGDKEKLEQRAFMEAFSETCVKDWEFIENINKVEEGETKETYMPFTKENAVKLFSAIPDLFDFIVSQATEMENFQGDSSKELAKN